MRPVGAPSVRVRLPARAVRAAALAIVAAACAGPAPSPAAPTPVEQPTASAVASSDSGPSAAASSSVGAIAVDAGLLDLLPARVDGIDRQADEATAEEIAGSAELAGSAEALAVAVYVGPPTASASVGDYAVVTMTRLRPGVLGEAFHRDWRDSFDAGVCAQAGGVAGNAEATIEGHRTFIGTCAGGVRTYHVVLDDARVLVSLQALGDSRLGERIVAGLAE